MDTPFTRAIDAGDVERARAFLRQLDVRAIEMEAGTIEGFFRLRHATSHDALERAARSWEALDRLCEPFDDAWDEDVARFLDATGLVDWGLDHLFVCDRRIAAFSAESWALLAAGSTDQEAVERCRRARSLGL